MNQAHFGPDSQFTTVFLKSGKKQVKMRSWHELYEAGGKSVVDQGGVRSLGDRRRLGVLRDAPSEYLLFRFVWSETRAKLSDLIPTKSTVTVGEPLMKGGVLSWQAPKLGDPLVVSIPDHPRQNPGAFRIGQLQRVIRHRCRKLAADPATVYGAVGFRWAVNLET